MNLTEHFTLEELVASDTAARRRIDNTPSAEIVDALRVTAGMLEEIRKLLGVPLRVTSGYRCLALNRAIGSQDTSDHIKGRAADFVCDFGPPPSVCRQIAGSPILFSQLIEESNSAGAAWTHIATGNGRQLLTINANGTRVGLA